MSTLLDYNSFVNFNIPTIDHNKVPQDQIPYILASIANETYSKANINPPRLYIYNKLSINMWYNQDFLEVARDIIAILTGRLTPGVSIEHIVSDIINKYLTCYASVQVLLDRNLKSQTPANLVAAAEGNARFLNEYKNEVSRVMMTNQIMGQQMMPMQTPGYQNMAMPGQYMMPMQPGMVPMQQGMMPMQQNMMPMQQGMMPMRPMYPNMPMQPGMTMVGTPGMMPSSDATQQSSSKYASSTNSKIPASYQKLIANTEEVNAFTAFKQNQAITESIKEQEKPDKATLIKRSEISYIRINNRDINIDIKYPIQSSNVTSAHYCDLISIFNLLKEAADDLRDSQIEEQGSKYMNQVYSAPYVISSVSHSKTGMSDLITGMIQEIGTYKELANTISKFYAAVDDLAKDLTINMDEDSTIELYERNKFIKNIDRSLTTKINKMLINNGVSIDIDNFSSDIGDLVTYLASKYPSTNLATKVEEYIENLVIDLKDSYSYEVLQALGRTDEENNPDINDTHRYNYYNDNAYLIALPISSDTYTLDNDEVFVTKSTYDIYNALSNAIKHSKTIHKVCTIYVITLDDVIYEVNYNEKTTEYKLTKV